MSASIRSQIRDALAEIYSGAGQLEADALIDKLAERGLVIVTMDLFVQAELMDDCGEDEGAVM